MKKLNFTKGNYFDFELKTVFAKIGFLKIPNFLEKGRAHRRMAEIRKKALKKIKKKLIAGREAGGGGAAVGVGGYQAHKKSHFF